MDVRRMLRRWSESMHRGADETRLRFRGGRDQHGLLLSERERIPQAMVYPLVRWQNATPSFKVFEIARQRAERTRIWRQMRPRVVFLQCRFNTEREEVESLVRDIRATCPAAQIVFLDWYAPVHLTHPWLFELVDLYVKKHTLKDWSAYERGLHDTNLVEYESQWDATFLPPREPGVARAELDAKLYQGWNFATDPQLWSLLQRTPREAAYRPIEVHCRWETDRGSPWYCHMRRRAFDAANSLDSRHAILSKSSVPWSQFWRELCQSQICISPFGYGEVCWRDFEAIAAGAILIKPDMSHLETLPNIFRAYETYVPVKWDWSDLQQQVAWVLASNDRQRSLAHRAVEVWEAFVHQDWQPYRQKLIDRARGRSTAAESAAVADSLSQI